MSKVHKDGSQYEDCKVWATLDMLHLSGISLQYDSIENTIKPGHSVHVHHIMSQKMLYLWSHASLSYCKFHLIDKENQKETLAIIIY